MKVLRNIFDFYINASVHVALAVMALTAVTIMEFNLKVSLAFWMFLFAGAITGYNFVKYARIAGLHHRQLAHSLQAIQVFSALIFLLLLYTLFLVDWEVLLVVILFAVPTLFYAVPLIRHKNLRSLTGIKIFVVAFVWAGTTVILPAVDAEIKLNLDIWLTFFQRMVIVVTLILPFEIRDVPYDDLNLKTLPQQIGVWGTKMVGEGSLLLCLTLEFFKEESSLPYLVSVLLFSIVLGMVLIVSKPQQSKYFASFWVEGLPILWWMAYVLIEMVRSGGGWTGVVQA